MNCDVLPTPMGDLEVCATEDGIRSVAFVEQCQSVNPSSLTDRAITQLHEYFSGSRMRFDLPLAAIGTPFQQAVWEALCRIEYGQTASYADVANALNNANAVRAVGAANGRNPIAIIVPCHRVIGANGKLTGYAGGLWRKQHLLDLEGARYTP